MDRRARRNTVKLEAELDDFLNRTYDPNASKFRHPGQAHTHRPGGKSAWAGAGARGAGAGVGAAGLGAGAGPGLGPGGRPGTAAGAGTGAGAGGRPGTAPVLFSRAKSARELTLGPLHGVPPALPPVAARSKSLETNIKSMSGAGAAAPAAAAAAGAGAAAATEEARTDKDRQEKEAAEDTEEGVVRADGEAVARAAAWVAALPRAHGPSNATAALRAALATPGADVVWWLSDGLPDNRQSLFKLLTYPAREQLPTLPLHALAFDPTKDGEANMRKAVACADLAAADKSAAKVGRCRLTPIWTLS